MHSLQQEHVGVSDTGDLVFGGAQGPVETKSWHCLVGVTRLELIRHTMDLCFGFYINSQGLKACRNSPDDVISAEVLAVH